jgi:hypothetical protein
MDAHLAILAAVEEMRRLHGPEAFGEAATRAAIAHLQSDEETFEFWRLVAVQLRQEREG